MNLKLHFIKSHTFPRQSWRLQRRTRRKIPPILSQIHKKMGRRYQGRWDKHMMADFVGCWRGNMWWRAESVKEIRYIGRSKIKRFTKARDLKEKPKHTLPGKILHLRSYILIESPIEIPQFAFIEFPESRGYRLKICCSRPERSRATLFQDSKDIISWIFLLRFFTFFTCGRRFA